MTRGASEVGLYVASGGKQSAMLGRAGRQVDEGEGPDFKTVKHQHGDHDRQGECHPRGLSALTRRRRSSAAWCAVRAGQREQPRSVNHDADDHHHRRHGELFDHRRHVAALSRAAVR